MLREPLPTPGKDNRGDAKKKIVMGKDNEC